MSIETAISNAYKSGREDRWEEARRILAVAPTHLAEANSEELRLRIARAETDLVFARSIEDARTQAEMGTAAHFYVAVTSYPAFAKSYSEVFAAAGFDVEGDSEAAARRIQSTPLAEQTITALDLWAFAAFRLNRESLHKQLLRIARLADPDPAWRDHLRDPAICATSKPCSGSPPTHPGRQDFRSPTTWRSRARYSGIWGRRT